MAKQQVTQTKSITQTRTRVKKDGSTNSAGYRQCNICHGTGVVQAPSQKKKSAKRGKR